LKISQLDLAVSDDYNDFAEKLIKEIEEQFFGKTYNSIIMAKFITYLRKEFFSYAKLKFDKNITIKVLIPRVPKEIIEKSFNNDKEEIVLRISFDKALGILKGTDYDYADIIYDLVNQFENHLKEDKTKDFRKYLITQVDSLSIICGNDLKSNLDVNMIKRNLIKKEGWRRLSKKSDIFNDYLKLFNENKERYTDLFTKFLKNILKTIDN
jgi:hypothetical protein